MQRVFLLKKEAVEAVEEFNKIFFKYYGQMLNDNKAEELAFNLLNVYRVVYREPSENKINN